MSKLFRSFVRLLLHLYPSEVRARDGSALVEAGLACLDRERRRIGRAGVFYAAIRLTIDAIAAAVTLRLDERRRRQIARQHIVVPAPKEAYMRLWQDVKYAVRGIARAPLFSAIVILTLALTIGATTAVFTVINAVLLRSLPYADPARLVLLYQGIPAAIAGPIGFSPPDYVAFERRAGMFESIAAFRNREYELSGVEPPERIIVTRASASLFETIGVRPAVGQAFTREEDESGRPVAVISDALWARKFGRDPGALGRAIMLDRQAFTIVGVMPRGFVFPNRGPLLNNIPADVYLPISFTAGERGAFGSMYNNSVIARLKPGVGVPQADADTRAMVRANAAEMYPAELSGLAGALTASVVPLADEVIGRSRTFLWVAFAAVGLVLLIACADLASLMLTRAMAREREIAVRTALGASRGRLVHQLLAESGVLAAIGSAMGLLVAVWLSRTLVTLAPPTLPRLHEIAIDGRILAFTATLSVLTAVLCGALPALELSRPTTSDALKEGGRTATGGRRQQRIFGTLVAAQVAVTVVLLVGGGLLLRSFSRLMSVDPGFRADHVLTLSTSLPVTAYPQGPDVRAFYTRLLDDVARLPSVRAAGASTDLPLGVRERRAFAVDGEAAATRELSHAVASEWVIGRYFESLGIPLKRGRFFTGQDDASGEPVAIVNETLARRFWSDADAIGKRIAWGGDANHGPWMRIVGIVGDVKQGPLNTETVPQTYTPWLQVSDSMLAENIVGQMRSLRIAIRTDVDPAVLASSVRQQVRALDPALPVTAVRTMDDVVRTSAAVQRFYATLVGFFALLALLLAAIGVAGLLATSVSRRAQELGIRLALGAQRGALVSMVVRDGMLLAAVGLAAGLPAAWILSRVLSALLFEVSPRDPLTFGGVAAVLAIVVLIACAVPAWRATRVDPLVVLRTE